MPELTASRLIGAETDFSARSEPRVAARGDFSLPGRIRISVRPPSLSDSGTPDLEKQFRKHERRWKRDTGYMSSLADKYLHPSYACIIGMGPPVVPMILRSLKRQPNDWFYALRAITEDDPVNPDDAGDVVKMAQAWLAWGSRRGLV